MHRFLALLKVREAEARGKAMILQARNDKALAFATEAHALASRLLETGGPRYNPCYQLSGSSGTRHRFRSDREGLGGGNHDS